MDTAGPAPQSCTGMDLVAQNLADRVPARILVVEDEDFVREVTCEVLLAANYLVLRARTASEAIRIFPHDGQPLQLLLTDVVLPGRSGYLLANDLRAISPNLKIVFISGYPATEVSKQGLGDGNVSYLPKPFSVEMLLEKVRTALSGPEVFAGEGKWVGAVKEPNGLADSVSRTRETIADGGDPILAHAITAPSGPV